MVKNYRVVVFGVKGVGKTAILEQAIYGHFSKNYVSNCCGPSWEQLDRSQPLEDNTVNYLVQFN